MHLLICDPCKPPSGVNRCVWLIIIRTAVGDQGALITFSWQIEMYTNYYYQPICIRYGMVNPPQIDGK